MFDSDGKYEMLLPNYYATHVFVAQNNTIVCISSGSNKMDTLRVGKLLFK